MSENAFSQKCRLPLELDPPTPSRNYNGEIREKRDLVVAFDWGVQFPGKEAYLGKTHFLTSVSFDPWTKKQIWASWISKKGVFVKHCTYYIYQILLEKSSFKTGLASKKQRCIILFCFQWVWKQESKMISNKCWKQSIASFWSMYCEKRSFR